MKEGQPTAEDIAIRVAASDLYLVHPEATYAELTDLIGRLRHVEESAREERQVAEELLAVRFQGGAPAGDAS